MITIHSLDDIEYKVINRVWPHINIVSIREPYDCATTIKQYEFFTEHRDNYKDLIFENFHDIDHNIPGYVMPQEENITRILDWAKDKEDIAVHCMAGVSRSSATAYLIGCSKMNPSEAIKVLDWRYHCPNKYILALGTIILKNPTIMTTFKEWETDNKEKFLSSFNF